MSDAEKIEMDVSTGEVESLSDSGDQPIPVAVTINEPAREAAPFPLIGKVAVIINERELAINIGDQDGVKKGMRFAVLAATPLEVRDPDTNELLGTAPREKVRVEAVEVQPRMTICSTYETRVIGGAFALPDISLMFEPRRRVPKTLRADKDSYPAPLSARESYVKIGDVVQELSER